MKLADKDAAFTRLASRVEALAVINLHSRVEAGKPSTVSNSCSQSSAECSACSDPNNSLTALKNAANSRTAIAIKSAQSRLASFGGFFWMSRFIFLTSRSLGDEDATGNCC